jgi:tRNA pseudouridine38-40 synthase
MKRIRLIIAYDGTDFAGWQIQNNAVTVEGVLTNALRSLLQEEVQVIGASRTDSGVHARGNVAVFDTETRIPPEKIAIALNQRLPETVRVQKSEEVPADFHPRYCDSVKTYEYTILNTKIQIPTEQRYSYHVYHKLDLDKMREAANMLIGTHDFSAFCSAGSQVKSKVRTIYDVTLEEQKLPYGNGGRKILIRISGNGFLYNMVRIIAGTLVEVGQGRRSADMVKAALEGNDRSMAGPTSPPQGLMLMEIKY